MSKAAVALLKRTAWYCRYGHNELDDPSMTLPLSCKAVKQHPPVLQLYAAKLHEQGVLDSSEVNELQVSRIGCLPRIVAQSGVAKIVWRSKHQNQKMTRPIHCEQLTLHAIQLGMHCFSL